MFGALSGIWTFGSSTAPAIWVLQLVQIAIPLTLVAVMVHAINASRQLRELSRAGYGIEDLRLALRGHAPHEAPPPIPLVGRLTSDAILLALVTYLGMGLVLWLTDADNRDFGYYAAYFYRQVAQWAYVVFWSGLGLSLLTPTRPLLTPGTMSRLRRLFWNSWAGALWLGLARVGLGKRIAAAETLHRPTELVLDLAIEELWRALPAAARREASELPVVARALRKRVAALRGIAGHFGEPSHDTPAEAALRTKVDGRISAALTALEQLRLQLLRLDGATVATGALTAQLHDARTLERELLTDLGANRGVGRLLRRCGAGRWPGITPTPA
jgi:hypothetical protein